MKASICLALALSIALVGCGSSTQLALSADEPDPVVGEDVVPIGGDVLTTLADTYWLVEESSEFASEFEPFVGFLSSDDAGEGLSVIGSDGCNGFGARLEESEAGGYGVVDGHTTEVLCLEFENTGLISAIIEPGPLDVEVSLDGESLAIGRAGGILFSRISDDPRG